MKNHPVKSPRLSWRKEKVRYHAECYRLTKAGSIDWLAIVQKCEGGWFWYGAGRNTASTPTDLETAKCEAMAHILEKRRGCGAGREWIAQPSR